VDIHGEGTVMNNPGKQKNRGNYDDVNVRRALDGQVGEILGNP
jgi:hypothetical protein